MDIEDFVNELPSSSRLGSLSPYLREEDLDTPIDMFKRSLSGTIQYGTISRLSESDFLGRLLVIGMVSAAEAYFRAVLSGCIEMCPVAQATASKQSIHLGGLLWHGRTGFSRSAFEHASFSSREELTSACKKFLSMSLDDRTFKTPLDEFETVCQLRHGIVHGDGLLPGRNAVLLDVPRYQRPVRIVVRYEQLQEIAAVLNTLVLTFNRELFALLCKRWAIDWRQRADWEQEAERERFSQIWALLHSRDEWARRRGRGRITKVICMGEVRTRYAL